MEDFGFPIGSKVMLIERDPCNMVQLNMVGDVCHVVGINEFAYHCNIGVQWNEFHDGYHSCNGRCEMGYGRYVPHTCLKLVDLDLGEIETGETDICSLFI